MLAEHELTSDDWRLVHSYRNSRALLRRRKLSKPMRDRLPADLARLEAAASARGIPDSLMRQWRPYPARGGDLLFQVTAEPSESKLTVGLHPPPSEAEFKRARRGSEPPAVPAGELMARLEQAIKDAVR
jgi:hypothetical protein